MLAERSGLTALLAAAGLAALTALVPPPHAPTVRVPAPVPPPSVVAPAPPACPAYVRGALRVDDAALLDCIPVATGTFAVARYHTTEWWQRMAIVATDGTLVAPTIDTPSPQPREIASLAEQYAVWQEPAAIGCE